MRKYPTFEEDLDERLKNPEFKKAWDESEAEYLLAKQIIEKRLAKKLSQRDLAKKVKTSQAAISRIESMNANQDLTISAWIKTTSSGAMAANQGRIISKRDGTNIGYELYVEVGATVPTFALLDSGGNDTKSGTITVTDTNWHLVTGTRSGNKIQLYIDGTQQVNITTLRTGSLANATNLLVGQYSPLTANRYWPGQIDDVKIYNYALTATQVKQLYNNGAGVRFAPVTGTP